MMVYVLPLIKVVKFKVINLSKIQDSSTNGNNFKGWLENSPFCLKTFVLTLASVVCVMGGRRTDHYMNDGISVKKTWHREVAGF